MEKKYDVVFEGRKIVYVRTGPNGAGNYQERSIKVRIDWARLLSRFGTRAVNSKSGRASALHGIIVSQEVR